MWANHHLAEKTGYTDLLEVGCLLGAALCFLFAHITGRRWTIAIGCLVLWVGAALQTSAFTISHFIGTKVLVLV